MENESLKFLCWQTGLNGHRPTGPHPAPDNRTTTINLGSFVNRPQNDGEQEPRVVKNSQTDGVGV